jgi:hypothetical protein
MITKRYKNGWIAKRSGNSYSGTVFKNGQVLFKTSISERAVKIWITKLG